MTLYLVGLGLGDEKDITVRGLEAVKSSDLIYIESYTSILGVPKDALEEFYEKPIITAYRETIEQEIDQIFETNSEKVISLLVVGDPFGATTHSDLVIRARQKGLKVEVIHNCSIMNAVGATGLQLYSFGQTVSIVFFTDTWKPDSFYDKIKKNRDIGLHTLCLLDIKVREQTIENLCKENDIYEPPRYMTANQCISQLLEVEESRGEEVYGKDTLCVAVARMGQPTQKIVAGTMEQLLDIDMGGPLHSVIIVGEVHSLELEYLNYYRVDTE
eukprot:TRINITY_DN1719_c0_g2_i1.p1 TRINITY_DN1719_c0_g2~~TRINITY_DN1719_c0_g2_i1.p1  ORF type:complete len:272 (-),score=62.84 TRINITY_DN1719_c0_g2_i1:132-947(-)